jgi:aminoglycoside phosphotransferase family enzyme/predicted kinase
LTEHVYLGTVPITREPDGFAVEGSGHPVEWGTLMRRLPADRMLDAMLLAGAAPAPSDLAGHLAGRLIPFHRDLAGACGHGRETAATLAAVVTDNLDELRPFAGAPLSALQLELVDEALRCFIAEQRPMMERRVVDGWIRDGHGDLRAEHICLEDDAIQIFDCVEFNPEIRCADVASDLAFLLMDLERLGAGAVASELEARYRAAGLDLPPPLLRFYRAHRALVRAKIDCLSMADSVRPHPGMAGEANRYLGLASCAALTIRPFLIAMTGLSGTGKSTVAASLAQATGAELISSDIVRKELAAVTGSASTEWGQGIYSTTWTERTYQRLLERAEEALADGHPAVLDATFLDGQWRQRSAAVAARTGVPFLLVETVSDEPVVAARIAARAARADSPSDATLEIYQRQRRMLESKPVAVPDSAIAVQVDTSAEAATNLDPVLRALREAGVLSPRVPSK